MAILTVEDWSNRVKADFPNKGVRVIPSNDDPDFVGEIGNVEQTPGLGITLTIWGNSMADLHYRLDGAEVTPSGWWVRGAEDKKNFLRPLNEAELQRYSHG